MADRIEIRYGDLELIADELGAIREVVETINTEGGFSYSGPMPGLDFMRQVQKIQNAPAELKTSAEMLSKLESVLDNVAACCEEKERAVKMAFAQNSSAEGYDYDPPKHSGGHAGEYYGGLDAAAAQAQKDKDDHEAKLAFLAEHFPLVYAAYMQKCKEAAEEAWLEELKNSDNPEDQMLYEMIMEQRKREEEARKAAEEAAAAFAGGSVLGGSDTFGSGGGSDLGSGIGSDLGGLGGGGGLGDLGSGLDDLGSDLGGIGSGGGGGGLSDLGSGWESELFDDAVDTGELMGASGALDSIAHAANTAAAGMGADAVAGEGDVALDGAAAGVFGAYGEKLASLVQAYGLQAAAVAGGAVALYATREQTTEAVAHMAEFVSTKCKPAAADVLDQVSGVAKRTRVKVSNATSRVVAAARGEEVGDLIV